MEKKIEMNNYVVGIRAIAIVYIILHHSLGIYEGWPPNSGLGILPFYAQVISAVLKWLGLSLFVFISGYCMYYSQIKRKPFFIWIKRKTIRILLPLVLFSFAYNILFPQFMLDVWPAPINGTHLWFLPMIFLCMLVLSLSIYHPSISIVGIVCIYLLICLTNLYVVPFKTFENFAIFFPIFVLGFWSHGKGLFSKSECRILFFRSSIIKRLSTQSFKLYLLHQFFVNLLLVCYVEIIRDFKYYLVIPFVFIFSLLLSLVVGIVYDMFFYRMFANKN